ncbi:FAD:protein FMN transferase [Gorillibacterium sp. sgz5001074]|uniref:FAD:protein FMN transferase n=1 Tax=Gorillibacterium sp. sgz5001074 TaxID=3446695 RepID=UPI003F6647B7
MSREAGQAAPAPLHTFRFRAMNTDVEAAIAAGPEADPHRMEEDTRDWFRYAEDCFSRFRPESELSRLNRLSGSAPVLISDTMLEVLALAEQYRRATGGIFDPLLGRTVRLLGYDASFEQVRGRTFHTPPANLDPTPSVERSYRLDSRMKSVLLPAGAELDLGGIAKSWTVKRAAAWLRSGMGAQSGMINAGGDLTIWSDSPAAAPHWRIGIQDPWNAEADKGYLVRTEGSAATSSRLGRQWLTDRGPKHHLIHPAAMDSADSRVVQCTVFGPDPVECEIWSKTICILGETEGLKLFHSKAAGYEALLFTEDGDIRGTVSLLTQLQLV